MGIGRSRKWAVESERVKFGTRKLIATHHFFLMARRVIFAYFAKYVIFTSGANYCFLSGLAVACQ